MIIALFGLSCSGKSTVATRLQRVLGFPLRSCGDAIRSKARFLKVDLGLLTDEHHRAVDAETRDWAASSRPCLIDGRYLNYVLTPFANDVLLVEMYATVEDRLKRRIARDGAQISLQSFQREEEANLAFSGHMYSMNESLIPSLVLNSSELSVEACTECVKNLFDNSHAARG